MKRCIMPVLNSGDTLLISVSLKLTESDSGEGRSAGADSEREVN